MIDVFKVFYPTHYNFAAVSILLVLLVIYLLTKKNFKWSLIFLAILLVFNIAIYKRTADKVWTITIEPEKTSDPYFTPQVQTMSFSAKHNWTITDEKGEVNIVAIVVLIGIAVLLALIFKDQIVALLQRLFGTISENADNAVGGGGGGE